MELTEREWAFLKKEIENVEYGRVVIFCSPDKRAFNFTIEKSYKLPIEKNEQSAPAQ
jgi:hypothetical protein